MSQVLPTPQAASVPPVLSSALAAQYNAMAQMMGEGFSGSFNRIKPGKADFTLTEGGVSRQVPNGTVVGILLGFSPVDFCTWYEKAYTPGQEPENPDLCWEWPDHNVFPDALPMQFRQKMNTNGVERWGFRIARRSVWALATVNPQTGEMTLGLQNPYILDITSASLFGKSNTQLNEFKWAGLMNFCNRFSQPPNFYCSPAMFMTQINIDMQSPVPGVVVFRPNIAADNMSPQYIDNTAFEAVANAMLSQQVKDMLKVREILEWPKQGTAHTQQVNVSAAPVQPSAAPTAEPVTTAAPQATTQPAGFTTPGPVAQPQPAPVQPQPAPAQPAPVQPQPAPAQPQAATPASSLLAQAKAAMSKAPSAQAAPVQTATAPAAEPAPEPVQPSVPIADGVTNVTAQAIDNLASMV